MVSQESEGIAIVDTVDSPDHECPYLDHVEALHERARIELNAWTMNALVRARIAAIHVDGECPPTHPGGPTSPSRIWADHVQTYTSPHSVI